MNLNSLTNKHIEIAKQVVLNRILKSQDIEKIKPYINNNKFNISINNNKFIISAIRDKYYYKLNSEFNKIKISNEKIKKIDSIIELLWQDQRVKDTLKNDNENIYNELIKKDFINNIINF
jgi:hypothetical protein